MSTPNPGDVLPLWNPDIPGEEIQTGRLGIRVRPGTPAAAKVLAMEAAGGAELLRQVLEEQRLIDGIYSVIKPEKPLEFTGQVSTTLLTGKLGRTPMGLALEITDWQDLDGDYEMEKNRLRLRYQELHVVKEWDGDLEGFTALVLREQAKTLPILDSTMRFIEHLRDYREKLARRRSAAMRRPSSGWSAPSARPRCRPPTASTAPSAARTCEAASTCGRCSTWSTTPTDGSTAGSTR